MFSLRLLWRDNTVVLGHLLGRQYVALYDWRVAGVSGTAVCLVGHFLGSNLMFLLISIVLEREKGFEPSTSCLEGTKEKRWEPLASFLNPSPIILL